MTEFTYCITDEAGIHARPAGLLVKEADKFGSDIEIVVGDEKKADAKRLFSVMSLGIKKGDIIMVRISGDDEEMACRELRSFFEKTL